MKKILDAFKVCPATTASVDGCQRRQERNGGQDGDKTQELSLLVLQNVLFVILPLYSDVSAGKTPCFRQKWSSDRDLHIQRLHALNDAARCINK